jgi:hypothetical protein
VVEHLPSKPETLNSNSSIAEKFLNDIPSFFLVFAVLGLELRVFALSHSTSPIFCEGFLKIRSCELFAQSGFEPQSF